MKKHDEGYVLAYVVVIMAVLTTIALSVMSVSLSNLQKQRAEVERMQDKYAAEGDIEKTLLKLNDVTTRKYVYEVLDATVITPIPEGMNALEMGETRDGVIYWIESCEENICILWLKTPGTVSVACQLRVTNGSQNEAIKENVEKGLPDGKKTYGFYKPEWEYVSYTITYVAGEDPEGGDPSEP